MRPGPPQVPQMPDTQSAPPAQLRSGQQALPVIPHVAPSPPASGGDPVSAGPVSSPVVDVSELPVSVLLVSPPDAVSTIVVSAPLLPVSGAPVSTMDESSPLSQPGVMLPKPVSVPVSTVVISSVPPPAHATSDEIAATRSRRLMRESYSKLVERAARSRFAEDRSATSAFGSISARVSVGLTREIPGPTSPSRPALPTSAGGRPPKA
jgi:hypothetical protein